MTYTKVVFSGGSRPVRATVSYANLANPPVPEPLKYVVGAGTANIDETSVTVGATPSPTTELGAYDIYAVVLTDADGCDSLYYGLQGTTSCWIAGNGFDLQPTTGADPTEHDRDLDFPFTLVNGSVDPLPNPANWSDAQKYYDALTTTFLSRHANGAELGSAASDLASKGRHRMATNMAQTYEWAGLVVDDIYLAALGRLPESTGRDFWAGRLTNGYRTKDIAVSIHGSTEAYNSAGGTDAAFIIGLYNRILGRDPDATGLAFWEAEMVAGRPPWSVVASFWNSIEFPRQRVAQVYDRVLHRPPDAPGQEYWAGRLLTEDDLALAALLASSDEFWNNAVGP